MRSTLGFVAAFALLGCATDEPGDQAGSLYPPQVETPIEFSDTDPAANASAQSAERNAPHSAPAPVDDSTPEPEAAPVICGDGICTDGEPESCWVDCVEAEDAASEDAASEDAASEDSSSPAPGPAEQEPAQPEPDDPPAPVTPEPETQAAGDDTWACVAVKCDWEWSSCMGDSGCATLHQCMLGCSGNDACKNGCLAGAPVMSRFLLDDVAICANAMGCLN